MLLEIANGNLTYRMVAEGHDMQFEELANLLNQVAEKLQQFEYSSPYKNSKVDVATANDTAVLIVQKVLDYIQNHLEEPLPSSKKLSKMFGTNEFTLKDNFRKLVKTSIYQFYNEERLKKSHVLIEKTTIPLKEIALLSGFTNYTNFYKAFKKKFNYPPSELDRKNADL
ncbi:MAG: AraC family transcriptional regulator [Flavobacteriaceae bacterium]|nr:AraC family transcriptional regulator [Flavobacteriaceae bacterium]